jgi:hypothetical protein
MITPISPLSITPPVAPTREGRNLQASQQPKEIVGLFKMVLDPWTNPQNYRYPEISIVSPERPRFSGTFGKRHSLDILA